MPSMPDPLHPAPVHLPIALAASIPILAIRWSLPAARCGSAAVRPRALRVGSAWLALETGEDEEERVEGVVVERHIEVQMSHGGGALAYAHGAAGAHLDRTAARR